MNKIDHDTMLGFLAACYLCGEVIPPSGREDPVYEYMQKHGQYIFDAALDTGLIAVVGDFDWDDSNGYYVTEAGRRFFEGGNDD